MHVLSLSLDPQVLNTESVVASRSIRYGEMLESYSIIVPSSERKTVVLSPHTTAYGTGGRSKMMQAWHMFFLARLLVKEQKHEVVTSQDTYFLGLLGVLLAGLYHIGLEVQVLGIEKLSLVRKMLSKFVLNRAGSIRVLSLRLKKRLIEEFGIKEDRMMLVPIYVDVSSLGFSTQDLTSDAAASLQKEKEKFAQAYGDRFNIVSVNRLVPIKNISMQLQAIETLHTELPRVLLHIVGDGPLEDDLLKEIEERGIGKHVVLEGYKAGQELNPFFTESDCFVLTSDFEGYGMVVVEAATAGLPIVMTDVGCAGEVVVDKKSGIVIPPRDAMAFTDALRKIIEDENLRNTLKEGALRSIAELPSFDTVLQKYKASWDQALENRK